MIGNSGMASIKKSLQHIRKVRSHPPKYQRPHAKHTDGNNPKIGGGIKMLPKPYFLKNRAAVTVHHIDQRIQLKQRFHIIGREHIDIPHDRRHPHTDLEGNTDHLLQIPDKDYQRARQIT